MSAFEPTPQEIQTARELGYVTQAAINGVQPDRIDPAVDTYRTQYAERDARLGVMHDAIVTGRKS